MRACNKSSAPPQGRKASFSLNSGRRFRARQEARHGDTDAVAVNRDRSSSDRHVVGENRHLVVLGRLKLDDGTAAHPEHLVDRHGGRSQHHRDIATNLIDCGHAVPPETGYNQHAYG
jgi:hypothetical protein